MAARRCRENKSATARAQQNARLLASDAAAMTWRHRYAVTVILHAAARLVKAIAVTSPLL